MNIASYEESLPELIAEFNYGRLIPFIGTGFSQGEKSKSSTVPGSESFRGIMIEELCRSNHTFSSGMFDGQDFFSISDLFHRNVEPEKISEILDKFFTKVSLSSTKKKFINLQWPYIYTLNIDDAIERAGEYYPIYSNRPLRSNLTADGCVFKMHGDATHDRVYADHKSVIFSKGQYLKSLKDNKSILSFLTSDLLQNSFLFIGCSLTDELDLRDISNEIDFSQSFSKRYYVTIRTLDPVAIDRLAMLGVTNIVVVESYDSFYEDFPSRFSEAKGVRPSEILAPFRSIKIQREGPDIDLNLSYLFSDYSHLENDSIRIPFYTIERKALAELRNAISQYSIVGVTGKRFSGKTLLLLTAIEKLTGKATYFFGSNVSLSDSALREALAVENSILYFDTNSLTFQSLGTISDSIGQFKSNKTTVVIAINNSDRIHYSILNHTLEANFVLLSNVLEKEDLEDLNAKLSRLGITKFEGRLSLLDNLFRTAQRYNIKPEIFDAGLFLNVSDQELKVIVLLLTFEKVYYKDLFDQGLTVIEIKDFERRYNAIVETEPTLNIEVHNHSRYKLSSNSNSILFHILSSVVESTRKARARLLDAAFSIVAVKHGLGDERYKQVIMFDNINFLASAKSKGSIDFIFSLYERLETILFEDPEYWHQRAKSILYSQNSNAEELIKAHKYGQKAYYDSRENSRTRVNASLTVSLICGRIANEQKFSDQHFVEEGVNWFFEALNYKHLNEVYLNYVLKKSRNDSTNDLYNLIEHCIQNMLQYAKLQEKINYLYDRVRSS